MLRRTARILGLVLTSLGVILLAWAAVTFFWGDPVTALYTRWEQRDLRNELAKRSAAFTAATTPPPAPGAKPKPKEPLRVVARRYRMAVEAGSAIGTIDVPRLGLDMVLVDGTDHDALKRGPGRDERTYMPGEGELVYIAGHRTTYGAPFAHIDSLQKGDRIELRLPYATAVYRVTRHVIVPADDLARLESHGTEQLALQACHPRFSAEQRYIVYARPVSFTRTG